MAPYLLTRPRNDDQQHAKCGRTQYSIAEPRRSILQDAFAAGQEAGKRFDYTPGIAAG